MKYRQKTPTVVATFRIPEELYIGVMDLVSREDSDFSKFMRNAVRREFESRSIRRRTNATPLTN